MKKIVLLLSFILVLTSCSKDENWKPDTEVDAVSNIVLQRILDLGFLPESIEEFEDYYVVEGDILFYKKDTTSTTGISKQQARSDEIANLDTDIVVYVEQNFNYLYNDISSATNTVITAYNSLPMRLTFRRTDNRNEANIIITCNNGLGYNVCGMGGFPSNGRVFPTVWISESMLRNSSITQHGQLVFLIAHEMGHNLGLRHTDWRKSEPVAIDIPGTPQSDSRSVMNSGTCGKFWSEFSQGDSDALKILYPYPSPYPRIMAYPVVANDDGTVWYYSYDEYLVFYTDKTYTQETAVPENRSYSVTFFISECSRSNIYTSMNCWNRESISTVNVPAGVSRVHLGESINSGREDGWANQLEGYTQGHVLR